MDAKSLLKSVAAGAATGAGLAYLAWRGRELERERVGEAAYQRAAKRDVRRTAKAGPDEDPLAAVADRDDTAAAALRLHVAEALEQLPADYQRVVELRMEGYEVAEIARAVGRSKRTVERLLQEARGVLRSALSETD